MRLTDPTSLLHQLVAGACALALMPVAPAVAADGPETPESYYQAGLDWVAGNSGSQKRAKNVILFVGDGMGVSTVTAARILAGQMAGQPGEENLLSFEKFPHVGMSRVYNHNSQVPDSAGTMTAMSTGVKTDIGVLGVDQDVVRGDPSTVGGNELMTIIEQAEEAGKSTGIVSTARLTHATPAALYAKSADRNWEDSAPGGAMDIASQLLAFPYGDGLEVAMGGGRRHFWPNDVADPEDVGAVGNRTDGRNLTEEWANRGSKWKFVYDQAGFNGINASNTSHLLGLFERSHMEYEHDRPGDAGGEPSLTDLTEKSIQLLSKNKKGFFLHVESGRIDHAHHDTNAYRALTETIEFARAIKKAYEMTDPSETLIIVTADHSHVFTMAGYPERGNPILGKVAADGTESTDKFGVPYTTLSYANGYKERDPGLGSVDTEDPDYDQEALVVFGFKGGETHSGEDVAIYATGPGADAVHGTMQQNFIYHVMAKAFGFISNGNGHGNGHGKGWGYGHKK